MNERDLILRRNAELRKNPGVIRDLTFGRQQLTIPKSDYRALCRKYPVILAGDADQQMVFWKRFIRSSESQIYRVQ